MKKIIISLAGTLVLYTAVNASQFGALTQHDKRQLAVTKECCAAWPCTHKIASYVIYKQAEQQLKSILGKRIFSPTGHKLFPDKPYLLLTDADKTVSEFAYIYSPGDSVSCTGWNTVGTELLPNQRKIGAEFAEQVIKGAARGGARGIRRVLGGGVIVELCKATIRSKHQ